MARSIAASAPGRLARGRMPRVSVLPSPLGRMADALRALARLVRRHRWLRVALLAGAIALPLLGGGWLLLRHSPFVSVEHVRITGVHGPEAGAVEAALARTAHGMSTLDVSVGALRAAVAPLRVVRDLRAIPQFPHGLRIEVSEQLPVASLTSADRAEIGQRTAVAADGVALGPGLLSGSLPSVEGSVVPAPGRRVGGAPLLAELAVLGAAPAPLARHVERVFTGPKGLTVAMRNGLLVYFGDASRPHAKWLSLARVLADPSSAGASYIDVRLPSHPAAGFPAGVTPPDASASAAASTASGEPTGSQESTIASLAAGLAGPSTAATPSGVETASGAGTSPSPQAGAGEAGSAAGGSAEAGSETGQTPSGAPAGGEAPASATGATPTG